MPFRNWLWPASVAVMVATASGCGTPAVPQPTSDPAGGESSAVASAVNSLGPADGPAVTVVSEPHFAAVTGQKPHDFASVLDGCPAPYEYCRLETAATYDAGAREWLILTTESHARLTRLFWLMRVTPADTVFVLQGSLIREGVPELSRALERGRRVPPTPNLIARGAMEVSRAGSRVAAVTLSSPLAGYRLALTAGSLAAPEHTLTLAREGRVDTLELGRRPANLGSCDENDWCGAHEGGCRDDELAAEDRLCVLPLSIDYVGVSPSCDSIAVLLTQQTPSSPFLPSYHWVIPLPDAVTASCARQQAEASQDAEAEVESPRDRRASPAP